MSNETKQQWTNWAIYPAYVPASYPYFADRESEPPNSATDPLGDAKDPEAERCDAD